MSTAGKRSRDYITSNVLLQGRVFDVFAAGKVKNLPSSSDGPFAEHFIYEKLFKFIVRPGDNKTDQDDIVVYFYHSWAEKLISNPVRRHDVITIFGPPDATAYSLDKKHLGIMDHRIELEVIGNRFDSPHIIRITEEDAKKARTEPPPQEVYEYKTLDQILQSMQSEKNKKLHDSVNTYAMVVSFTPPKELGPPAKDKYMASYFLLDSTITYHKSSGICLNVFANDLGNFPTVLAAGDIMRIHRASAQDWNGLQLTANMSRTKSPSFLVMHQKVNLSTGLLEVPSQGGGLDLLPPGINLSRGFKDRNPAGLPDEEWVVRAWPKQSQQYSWSLEDARKVHEMEVWGAWYLAETSLADTVTVTFNCQKLVQRNAMPSGTSSELLHANNCDLVCVFVTEGQGPKRTALVWDGTLPGRIAPINPEMSESLGKPKLWSSICAAGTYSDMTDFKHLASMRKRVYDGLKTEMPREIYGKIGALEVRDEAIVRRDIPNGSWIRIRNLKLPSPQDREEGLLGIINRDTHVTVLPPYARDVTQLAAQFFPKQHAILAVSGAGAAAGPGAPPAARLTHTDLGEPITKIALAQSCPTPAKFCCKVNLTGWFPDNIKEWVVDREYFMANVNGSGRCGAVSGSAGQAVSAGDDEIAEGRESSRKHLKAKEFLFSLRFEDDTGRINDAICSGKVRSITRSYINQYHTEQI